MKLFSIILVSTGLLMGSCASDSEQTDSSNSTGNSSSTTAPSTNTNTAPAATPDFNNQQQNVQAPQPVPPTLPNNVRRAAQQNAMQQQQQQFQQQQQQQIQQQQQATQTAPVKTIGDERTAHFICPNACKGSGADAAAMCPTCGTQYTHNTESPWHEANNQNTPTAAPAQPTNQAATPAVTAPVVNTNPLPTGDHNTSHYVCPDRCVGGGSGGPGKCPTCAKDYVHNAESPAHLEEVRRREQQQQP